MYILHEQARQLTDSDDRLQVCFLLTSVLLDHWVNPAVVKTRSSHTVVFSISIERLTFLDSAAVRMSRADRCTPTATSRPCKGLCTGSGSELHGMG